MVPDLDITLIETLLPIHILWINLVTDSLPALALAVDPAADNVMKRKPLKNTKKGIFTKGMTWRIVYQGLMIGLLTLAAFIIGLGTKNVPQVEGMTTEQVRVSIGQTMAFIVLALSELVHVFNIRNNSKSIFKTGIFNNGKLISELSYLSNVQYENFINTNYKEYKERDDDKLDIEAIYNYSQNIKNQNPHTVKARYIKGIEALNGK